VLTTGVLVAPAAAAPGGDATIMATGSVIANTNQNASGVVMCPAGTRAVGGGAQPLNGNFSPNNNAYRVGFSGPVDDTGTPAATATGDVPRGWFVGVTAVSAIQTTFRTYAICSATSDATIESTLINNQAGTQERRVDCTGGTRAIGGGVTTSSAVSPMTMTHYPYINRSVPVDSSGTLTGTQTGDVPTAWLTSASPQNGSLTYHYLAICSAASDATVQVAGFTVVNPPADGSSAATAICPAGQRALSGGVGVDTIAAANYRTQVSGPLDASASPDGTDVGDVARSWYGAARTASGTTTAWRTIAVCATDDVPAPPPAADTTPPDTIKGKGPKKKTTKRKATFEFSSEAGATFECALDKKPAAACASPAKVKKLKPGKHKFTVTAIDAAGNRDPSPASWSFKVKK
jgi:hypothetical protein